MSDTFSERNTALEKVQAITFEPVLGESGYPPVPFEMMTVLREICYDYGILLIADEVLAGFGRTGK